MCSCTVLVYLLLFGLLVNDKLKVGNRMFGVWILDFGVWSSDFGFRKSDVRSSDVGSRGLEIGCLEIGEKGKIYCFFTRISV